MTLQEEYDQVVAEDNSPSKAENQAMALRRYAQNTLGVTDEDKLHQFFNEAYALLTN